MALLPVAGLVNEFSVGPLTLSRRGPPTKNAYGEFVEPAAVNIVLNPVTVHNADGRARENLPEALRQRETIEVYTKVRLYAGDGFTDRLTYQGRSWVVSLVMDYDLQGGVYISLATLEDTV